MASNFNLEVKNNYIYLTLSGKYDLNLFLSYGKKVQATCEEMNLNKVLVNSLNVEENTISAKERQFIGINLSSDSKRNMKIASVWNFEDFEDFKNSNEIKISENYRVFGDLETAENWLLDK